MEIGIAEPIVDAEPDKVHKSRSSPGGSNKGGGDGGNPGDNRGRGGPGGDDFSSRGHFADTERTEPAADKSKVVMWFLLLVVTMTFGGLIGTYVVLAVNRAAEWNPFELPVAVWVSTALIIFSSFAYHLAKKAVDVNDVAKSRKWFVVTSVLGAAFISSQILVWFNLVERGLYMTGNPYAGFFYILTGVHAAHVIGGIIALGAILLRSWYISGSADELLYRRQLARSVGWYWHFMGILWIFLFLLLGYFK